MAMDVLIPIGQGFQYGAVVTNSKRLEDSVRAGGNGFMTMACQSSQVAFTLLQADRATEAAGVSSLPLPARILLVITPALLNWITYMGVENDIAREIVVFLQDQIGNVCQIAGVVSSVALIFFGQAILGGVSVGFLGVGFLDRHGLLPECVRHVIHDYTPTAAMAAGILVGGTFEKIFGVANLAIFCYTQFQSYQSSKQLAALDAQMTPEMRAAAAAHMDAVTQKDARLIATEQVVDGAQGPLTADKLRDHLAATAHVLWGDLNSELTRVDLDHIYYRTRPKAPDVDYRQLKAMFEKIDWTYKRTPASSSALDVARRKCALDQRFMKREGNPLKKNEDGSYVMSDAYLMKYAKESFDACIDQIYSHHIPDGEPRNYDELEDYLKIITHALQQKALPGEVRIQDNERIDTLITLAVDGGRYCGPGKFEVIERLYAGLVCEGGNCPTRKKVLNILQDKRSELVMGMYAKIPELFSVELPKALAEELNNPDIGWYDWMSCQYLRATMYLYNLMIDWHDKHVYNQFLNMYASDLGIRKASADNDATAVIDPTLKLAFQFVANMFKANFMNKYPQGVILETVRAKMGTQNLSKQELTDWWVGWVTRQNLDQTQKDALLQEFADNTTLFGKVVFDETGALTEPFLVAMLYDMGVYGEQAAATP